jgi:hypothetical protein
MHVKLIERIKRGWGKTVEIEVTPAEAKAYRLAHTALKNKAKAKGKYTFDITRPGDMVYLHMSGTCSELTESGLCLECMGSGQRKNREVPVTETCPTCNGTGNR